MIKVTFRPRPSLWTRLSLLGRGTLLTLRCIWSEETAAHVLFEANHGADLERSGPRHPRS